MNAERGFTLIEVLVTISVIAVGVMSILTLMFSVVRVNQQADDRSQAVQLAQREFDVIKRTPLTTIPSSGQVDEAVTYNNRAFTVRKKYCGTPAYCAGNQKSVELTIIRNAATLFTGETVLTDLRAK